MWISEVSLTQGKGQMADGSGSGFVGFGESRCVRSREGKVFRSMAYRDKAWGGVPFRMCMWTEVKLAY